ncbi:MAG: RNA repair transcriptional activator RtcR [Planctomycetota bacterium]
MATDPKRTVVLGFLGSSLDAGHGAERWDRWRPSVSLCRHDDLVVDRFELFIQRRFRSLAEAVAKDIRSVSPETEVRLHELEFENAWDFGEVFDKTDDFARSYPFDPEREDYLVHVTTGTHVVQICLFLLVETRRIPARLVQTAPAPGQRGDAAGTYSIIDLDLGKYDRLATRAMREQEGRLELLKSGIRTKNRAFNALIERVERVAAGSRAPILLTGPTGAGKSQLARRVFELKQAHQELRGSFVEVNCATLRGEGAMSALFGHRKGAFTGALADRPGLLRAADRGLLFLDEIGELGQDEQAMLLRALEEKRFLPVGADKEVESDFQLIAGTNRDLASAVRRGSFREDLLARIDLWTFELPALRARPEDIEPNLDWELERWEERHGRRVTFNKEARERFLAFATSREGVWRANFRDFNAALVRMATLAPKGRVDVATVEEELERLRRAWRDPEAGAARADGEDRLVELLGRERIEALDRFDRVQLADVVSACASARSLSEAGRELFATSRAKKTSSNDADRLRKYLARFGLDWARVKDAR